MGANSHANGGMLMKSLRLPDFRDNAAEVTHPGGDVAESTRVQGKFIRDVMRENLSSRNFRTFSPDTRRAAWSLKK
jgi:xylulose-5-phosphate/fructose-6-phosphate phosphoketolase